MSNRLKFKITFADGDIGKATGQKNQTLEEYRREIKQYNKTLGRTYVKKVDLY